MNRLLFGINLWSRVGAFLRAEGVWQRKASGDKHVGGLGPVWCIFGTHGIPKLSFLSWRSESHIPASSNAFSLAHSSTTEVYP